MSRVNLLPPEILQRQRSRQIALLVIGAGGVVLALIAALYVIQIGKLSDVNEQVVAQQGRNAQLQTQIAGLQKFQDLQTQAQAKQALLDAAFVDEISLSGLLMDVSRVVPTNQYLDNLTVQLTATAPGATGTTTPSPFVGTLTADGQTDTIESLAAWLTGLGMVKGWVNPWVTTIDKTTSDGIVSVAFTSGSDLTSDVITDRGAGAATGGSGG